MTILTNDTMKCTSCNKPKAALKQKKSKVLPGVPMYMCQDCLDNKREPRGFIVLAGRSAAQKGDNPVEILGYWIKGKRYCGADITLRELT